MGREGWALQDRINEHEFHRFFSAKDIWIICSEPREGNKGEKKCKLDCEHISQVISNPEVRSKLLPRPDGVDTYAGENKKRDKDPAQAVPY